MSLVFLDTTKKSPFRDGQNPSLNRSNPSLYGLRDGFRDGYCPSLKPLSLIRVRDGFRKSVSKLRDGFLKSVSKLRDGFFGNPSLNSLNKKKIYKRN